MGLYSYLNELYSLDTLDTRFTTSSQTPLKVATEESIKKVTTTNNKDVASLPPGASPSRWNTLEFAFYGLVFVVCVPQMYLAVVWVSQPGAPNYEKFSQLLSPGWMLGWRVDNSDLQYASFRNNIPALAALVVVHPLLRRAFEALSGLSKSETNGSARGPVDSIQAQNTLRSRLTFDFYSALVYIIVLHGFSALKIMLILTINYAIGMQLPRHVVPWVTWTFNIVILFANELGQGYSYTMVTSLLTPLYAGANDWGRFLDSWGGLNSRWEVLFNITVLRLISFNIDYVWSLDQTRAGSPVEKKQLDPANLSDRDRVSIPAAAHHFTSFRTYIAYAIYPPLYLAGPILTFNDYISQSTYRSPAITIRRTLLYGVRFLLTLLCMELLLHTAYVVAISKADPDWSLYSPFQLSMLAYFNLQLVWLKLLIPWRFFRLWSLIDGIDPPENVIRCMSDNYSGQAFWRAWHRSFNRWIVRYIYIPLGGAGGGTGKVRGVFNMLLVFTFVALWHDIQLRLLMWSWLIVLFIAPEILAGIVFPKSKFKDRPNTYRMLCGVGAVLTILTMMTANLVGFAIGLDGLEELASGIFGSYSGMLYMIFACFCLFVGVQVMFEHREEEKRKGIRMKC